MSRLLAWLVALAMSLGAFSVQAQPSKDAGKHFDRGLVLFKQRKFLQAADEFNEAYRIFPHGDALFNAGMAWESAGMRAVAATAYARALEEGVRPKTESKARSRLTALESQLAKVVLEMPPGSSVNVDVLTLEGERVVAYAEPGERTFVITLKSGDRVTRSITATPGATLTESVELPKPPEKPPPPPPPPPKKKQEAEGGSGWRTAGYVSLGLAGVATGAAIIVGMNAVSARNDFNDSGQTDRDAHDRALSNMHLANVCWAVAAVSAVGGGVLLFYVAPKVEATDKEKSGSVTIYGRF